MDTSIATKRVREKKGYGLRRQTIDDRMITDDKDKAIKQYRKLAAKLGIATVPGDETVQRHKLLAVLQRLGIAIYPINAVRKYMDEKCIPIDNSWYWIPLRRRDRGLVIKPNLHRKGIGWMSRTLRLGGTVSGATTYNQELPSPVLMRINEVQEELPEAMFYVTDTRVQRASKRERDPFLGVTLPGLNELFVIERWDEPGFRI